MTNGVEVGKRKRNPKMFHIPGYPGTNSSTTKPEIQTGQKKKNSQNEKRKHQSHGQRFKSTYKTNQQHDYKEREYKTKHSVHSVHQYPKKSALKWS